MKQNDRDTGGESIADAESIVVNPNQSLFDANDEIAQENRRRFAAAGVVTLNLISSPGSGKTTLLEKTIETIGADVKIGVIEGDIETERDAERIRAKGVPVIQLTTGGACHLDGAMIQRGFEELRAQPGGDAINLLIIENVGNLVCPASFDLGETQRIVLVSVPEGPDKPAKYPKAFTSSQVFLITKTDLLPYFDFAVQDATNDAIKLNPALTIMALSAVNGDGLSAWHEYLKKMVAGSS
jgi:hydrogenase nickel incorporation protein HypB